MIVYPHFSKTINSTSHLHKGQVMPVLKPYLRKASTLDIHKQLEHQKSIKTPNHSSIQLVVYSSNTQAYP